MELPTLKLEIIEGPRKGETLDFPPRSTVRIGRVVRGNNVAVKDSGISSKHLLIGCESGKWTIQDLDSSNGTALNSSRLPPFTPFDLRDGDVVKLGESSSIAVRFGDLPSQVRRNPRRKGNREEKKCADLLENDEKLEESEAVVEKRRGRPRRGKDLDRVSEVDEELENVAVDAGKPEDTGLISDKELENKGSVAVKSEMGSVNVRVTGSRKNSSSLVSENLGRTESLHVRATRSRKNNDSLISESMGVECAKMERGGRGRRKNLPEVPLDETMGGEKEGLDTERKSGDAGAGANVEETGAQAKVNDAGNSGLGKETVDLENMTLGAVV